MFNTMDHKESKTPVSRPVSEVHSHHKSKKHKHGSKSKHGHKHGHGHGHAHEKRRYTEGLGTLNSSLDPISRNIPTRRLNLHNTA